MNPGLAILFLNYMRLSTFLAESGLENSFPKSCSKRHKCTINFGTKKEEVILHYLCRKIN